MKLQNKIFLIVFGLFILSSCGVKSRPLPPEISAPLGRGEPTKAPEAKKKKEAIKNKYNIKDDDGSLEAE
jgi:hypothetical protein